MALSKAASVFYILHSNLIHIAWTHEWPPAQWGRSVAVNIWQTSFLGHQPTSTHVHRRQNGLSVSPEWGKREKGSSLGALWLTGGKVKRPRRGATLCGVRERWALNSRRDKSKCLRWAIFLKLQIAVPCHWANMSMWWKCIQCISMTRYTFYLSKNSWGISGFTFRHNVSNLFCLAWPFLSVCITYCIEI